MAQAVGAKPAARPSAALVDGNGDGSDGGILHVVIKADVQGSAEALADAVSAVKAENASVDVLRAGENVLARVHVDAAARHSADRYFTSFFAFPRPGVGLIAPGDISLATTTNPPAVVFGFGVKPDKGVENMARREGVDLKMSEIIYDLIDDVEERLYEGWGNKTETLVVGQAEVLKVFALRGTLKGTVIAGELLFSVCVLISHSCGIAHYSSSVHVVD